MDAYETIRRIAGGNYHRPDGLRALHLGKVDGGMFKALQQDVATLLKEWTPSIVREGTHSTGWTEPVGEVKQWSLFNGHGRTDDTSDDFEYGDLGSKRPVPLPGVTALAESLPDLVNLRLNLLGPGSSLSPHEERLERVLGGNRVALRGRFHLPLRTTQKALMLADGDLMHFEAGHLYFFNNGCVHSAENGGKSDRLHLVWDQLMTEEAVEVMFGELPPDWLAQDLHEVKVTRRIDVSDWREEPARLDEDEFYARELVFHP